MSDHKATIHWTRQGGDFDVKSYNRDHTWQFPGGERVNASAAAAYLGRPEYVDPEQGLAAAVSACHMLTFLYLAAMKKLVVDSYHDDAEAFLGKNNQGRMTVTRVVLRPTIKFADDAPDTATLNQLHHRAHKGCFIANALSCEVEIE